VGTPQRKVLPSLWYQRECRSQLKAGVRQDDVDSRSSSSRITQGKRNIGVCGRIDRMGVGVNGI